MADRDPPPAKPKPGSLRDRIAAFEQKPTNTAPPPPVPRPKPGNVRWEPKVASPPASPPAASKDGSNEGGVRGRLGGMSAADAKQSIGLGGSLKERMAALQGKGGFGAPAPPPVPAEKPKWKPPPVITPPAEDTTEHPSDDSTGKDAHGDDETPANDAQTHPEEHHGHGEEKAAESATEAQSDDPEDEERKRRAAIAARMARLGGARVGMAPPVFGYKPLPKKTNQSKKSSEDAHSDAHMAKADFAHEEGHALTKSPEETHPNMEAKSPMSAGSAGSEVVASDKDASQTSITSPSSVHAQSPPLAMPAPAVPRRTGPPRKRSAKSTTPSVEPSAESTESPQETPKETSTDNQEIAGHAEDTGTASVVESKLEKEESVNEPTQASYERLDNDPVVSDEERSNEANIEKHPSFQDEKGEGGDAEEVTDSHPQNVVIPPQTNESELDEVPEDEDEVARRKRIAERIAKSGGYNPLAGGIQLPRRKASDIRSPERADEESKVPTEDSADQQEDESEEPPPPPPRRRSVEVGKERVVSPQPEIDDENDEDPPPPPPPRRVGVEHVRRDLPQSPQEADEVQEDAEDELTPPPPPPRSGRGQHLYQSPEHENVYEEEEAPPPPPRRRSEHSSHADYYSNEYPADEDVEEPPPPPPPRRGSRDSKESGKESTSPVHPRKRPSNALPPVPSEVDDGN